MIFVWRWWFASLIGSTHGRDGHPRAAIEIFVDDRSFIGRLRTACRRRSYDQAVALRSEILGERIRLLGRVNVMRRTMAGVLDRFFAGFVVRASTRRRRRNEQRKHRGDGDEKLFCATKPHSPEQTIASGYVRCNGWIRLRS